MGVDSGGYRCRWVRDRLPLLAGGELVGADRRTVERHLVACPGCRHHEHSLSAALGVLQAAAMRPSADQGHEAPSLWPALARQIRESRHEPVSRLDVVARLFGVRPALVLAAALFLAALTAAGVQTRARWRLDTTAVRVTETVLPSLEDEGFEADMTLPPPVLPPVTVLEPLPSSGPKSLVRDDAPVAPTDRTASRFDYDLDHGTPMGPDSTDVKASY